MKGPASAFVACKLSACMPFACALSAFALFACAGSLPAQAREAPTGEPRAAEALRDPEFGVRTRQFGLQRRVEMYQWRKDGGRYARVWSAEPIPSAGHDPGHANPGALPIRTRYWIARGVTLDGRPLQEDVLKELGRWRGFRPGFTALPGNLAATFQPEGDGLSSAENPLDPRIGDLRIAWLELTLPPLAGKVALEDGVWVPAAARDVPEKDASGIPDDRTAATRPASRTWLLGGALVLAALAVWLMLRRRRRP